MHKINALVRVTVSILLAFAFSSCTDNSDLPQFELFIQNHHFKPQELILPEKTKISLVVHNQDDTAEEFECQALRKEKIIPAKSSIKMIIQPLEKGEYEFFGEFHPQQAQGKIVVK